tara:strand:+ start:267 stop:935 length:669 start_codon:yes stop_codon:yes gene_type:complete
LKKIKFLFPCLIGISGFLTLLFLGDWQLKRLEWKLDKIYNIEQKLTSLPVNLPESPQKDKHQYLSVKITGEILTDELHVLTSTKQNGPGFKIISPLLLSNGKKVLIDQGFIVEKEKDNIRKKGFGTIKGNLLWPNEVEYFTPNPNFEENIWFARDLEMMSEKLGTSKILVIASDFGFNKNVIPTPINTNLRNNHLQYAITWFSLSLVWIGMTLYWIFILYKK